MNPNMIKPEKCDTLDSGCHFTIPLKKYFFSWYGYTMGKKELLTFCDVKSPIPTGHVSIR